MSQTLQNQLLIAKSMNGIITLTDGAGSTITNGTITTGNIAGSSITGTTIIGTSFSTIGKSQLETVLTVATSATPYNWAYNSAQNIVFTGSTTQVFNLPLVTTASLGTTINIYRTSAGGFTINPYSGYSLFDYNNTAVTSRGLAGNDRFVTLTAISIGTTQWQLLSQSTNANLNATLAFTQTFTGLKTFSGGCVFTGSLPTTALAPTLGTQLVNKDYADSIGTTLLSSNNVWTGTNAFDTSLPTSIQTPTTNTQLVTKVYADGLTTNLLAANNVWTGTNAFNTSLPTSTQTPTTNTQLVTKVYADALPATLRGLNNVWTGTNAFNTSLPTSTQTPSSNTQLVTKVYADALPATLRGLNNTWTGTNLFNNNVTMGTGYFLPYFPLTSTSMRMGLNTLQNSLATSVNNLAWGNGCMQGTTNPAYVNLYKNCIALGNGCMSNTTYGTYTGSTDDVIAIGFDCAKQITLNSIDSVVIGSQAVKSGVGSLLSSVVIGSRINILSGVPQRSVIIGSNGLPSTAVNDAVVIGYAPLKFSTLGYFNGAIIIGGSCMQYAVALNRVICIGDSCLTNINNNVSTICIGMQSLQSLTTGTFVVSLGSFSNCSAGLSNCTMLGSNCNADENYHSNSVYFGGNDGVGTYQDLLIARKNRIYCVQNFSSVEFSTIDIVLQSQENVVIDNSVITGVNLPPIDGNTTFGSKYTLTRSSAGTSSITIDAGTGYFIKSSAGLNQTITWSSNEQYITLVCVSVTTWNVVCNDLVNKIITTNTTTNATFYPTFVASNTSGAFQDINMNTTLSYNPSTNNLTTTTFTGNLVGNATTTTNVTTTLNTTSTVLYPLMGAATSGSQGALANTNLKYNASTGQLEATKVLQTGLNGFAASPSVGGVQALTFGMNETVIFDSSPITTAVQLPSAVASGIGARFTFICRVGNANRNILSSGTEQIWDFRRNYATTTLAMNGIGSLTLVCVGTGAGNNCWAVLNRGDETQTAAVNIIAANFSFATAGNLPVRDAYSVANGATAITITLLTITLDNLGMTVLFRRVATATATVSFIGNGTQFVYNNALTGGATAQAIMTSTTYIVQFKAMVVSGVTYAWFQV